MAHQNLLLMCWWHCCSPLFPLSRRAAGLDFSLKAHGWFWLFCLRVYLGFCILSGTAEQWVSLLLLGCEFVSSWPSG